MQVIRRKLGMVMTCRSGWASATLASWNSMSPAAPVGCVLVHTSRRVEGASALSDIPKLKQSAFTILFVLWAIYLIAKGIDVGDGSQTRDAAEAAYFVGGAIVAALALLPHGWSRS